jgi:hypothetical protein
MVDVMTAPRTIVSMAFIVGMALVGTARPTATEGAKALTVERTGV